MRIRVLYVRHCFLSLVLFSISMAACGAELKGNDVNKNENKTYGLTQEQFQDLCETLEVSVGELTISEDLAYYKSMKCDILPFLMEIIDDTKRNEICRGYEIKKLTVLSWIALSKAPRTEETIYNYFWSSLPKVICKDSDVSEIKLNLVLIGFLDTRKSQELLFSLLQENYWIETLKIRFDMPPRGKYSGEQINKSGLNSLRAGVLNALATTGSDAVLNAFHTGKLIPEDLKLSALSYFKFAANQKVLHEGHAVPFNGPLPQETKNRLEEIYKSYGETYVVPPVKNLTFPQPLRKHHSLGK